LYWRKEKDSRVLLIKRRRFSLVVVILAIIFLSVSSYVGLTRASEPSPTEIFNFLGFTNVTETTVETFPSGKYNITLYAEFAAYHNENELSHYKLNTSIFNVIFTGPEGGSGYVNPPVTKIFVTSCEFGISMLAPDHRYFTETSKNPDGEQHAKVYRNLDDPSMFLVGFENLYGAGDRDYNDMVFSLKLQHYLTVVSPYDTPGGEGWYNNGTYASASLASDIVDHGNGTRRVFTHWSGDALGTNYSESEPICMNQNKTAIANWKTQFYLTVDTDPTGLSPATTPSSGWHDEGTDVIVTAPDESYMGSTKYLFVRWEIDGVPQCPCTNPITVNMNTPHTAIANYSLPPSQPPHADFTWLPTTPKVGETVTFDASSSYDSDGSIFSYEWSFSDGGNATGKIVTHTFATGGAFSVTLNVTDNDELWGTKSETITVVAPHGPEALFTWLPTTPKVGETVTFDASASKSGWNGTHGMPITEYRWDFDGDGHIDLTTSDKTVSYTYTTAGIYYPKLTVYALGATPETDSATGRIVVSAPSPPGPSPVGGFSDALYPFKVSSLPLALYALFIVCLAASTTLVKCKRK
jgi:PKD repeat protein